MGALISYFKSTPVRIVCLGLDASGKSTLFKRLSKDFRKDEAIHTLPTIGFSVEDIRINGHTFSCWDIGGQSQTRQVWYQYLVDVNLIIYLIDVSDPDRWNESIKCLAQVLNPPDHNDDRTANVPVYILFNKRDTVSDAVLQDSKVKIVNIIQKELGKFNNPIYIGAISALSGDHMDVFKNTISHIYYLDMSAFEQFFNMSFNLCPVGSLKIN